MTRGRFVRKVLGVLLGVSFLPAASGEMLKVFAAASLTDALKELVPLFEKEQKGVRVELNLAGSQLLQTQIEQGAPADVFLSADLVHMEALTRQKLVVSYERLAQNELAVGTPKRGTTVKGLSDLGRSGVRVVLAAPTVPAGIYPAQMLAKMGKNPSYGANFEQRVLANVVIRETSVRAVLAKVALGEADAGIVYLTDAASAPKSVVTLRVPPGENILADYAVAVLAESRSNTGANQFVRFLLSEKGQKVLKKCGVLPPPPPDKKRP